MFQRFTTRIDMPRRGRALAAALGLCAVTALSSTQAQAQVVISANVEGVLSPGVYGRIDIGSLGGIPPVISAQPVIIQPVQVVHAQPMYLHVPPGHRKKWGKHCARYNACGVPVYFVDVRNDGHWVRPLRVSSGGGDWRRDDHDHRDGARRVTHPAGHHGDWDGQDRHKDKDKGKNKGHDKDKGHGKGLHKEAGKHKEKDKHKGRDD